MAGLLMAWAAGGPATAATSPPDTGAEGAFLAATNNARATAGLAGLQTAADLVAAARQHAEAMAAQQRLFDDPNLANEVQGWQALGENSGMGPSVDSVEQAFMGSAPHRANILGSYTQVGIGVVWTGSTLWVAEIFRQPSGAAPPPPAPSPPPAPPAPSSPPRPAPQATHLATSVAARPASATAAAAPAAPAVPAAPPVPAPAVPPSTVPAPPTTAAGVAVEAAPARPRDVLTSARRARASGPAPRLPAAVVLAAVVLVLADVGAIRRLAQLRPVRAV